MNRDNTLRASVSTVDVFQDENCSSSSSFSNMTQAFSQRISELQQLVCFRVEDSVKHIFIRDIQGIEASIRALEQLFDELRQRTQQEMASIPKARALLQAADLQQQHLQQIGSNLPQHLPSSCQPPSAAAVQQQQQQQQGACQAAKQGANGMAVLGARPPAKDSNKDDGRGAAGGRAADKSRKGAAAGPAVAPRWYLTSADLASVPSYIKGRLTLEKVNAAVDELAGFSEANHKAMASVARNQLSRVAAEERVRLQDLYHHIASKEAAKGRFWFLETDLKVGQAVKMDKTGKSMLMLLRNAGRLQEVRAALDSMGSITAYVLQPQA